jgi:Uma2 family endonuclease
MATPATRLPGHTGPFTYDDLRDMPADGLKRELLDGALVVTPATIVAHQRAVLRLSVLLDAAVPAGLEVLPSPVDWVVSSSTVFQPDVVVIGEEPNRKHLSLPPLLVVEVLSPSTRIFDLNVKLRVYGQSGVKHYWVVDVEVPSLRVYEAEADELRLVAEVTGEDTWHGERPFTVDVNPAALVAARQAKK